MRLTLFFLFHLGLVCFVGTGTGYLVWATEVFTHELGHNFGCSHDSDGNECDGSAHIMAAYGSINPSATESAKDWSTCSESYIGAKIQGISGTLSDCLINEPTPLTPVCGDGIVSGDEECDFAASIGGNLCTEACVFKEGISCTAGECCDINTGDFQPTGYQCRESMHQCDLLDRCDGSSALCPTNEVRPDGTHNIHFL